MFARLIRVDVVDALGQLDGASISTVTYTWKRNLTLTRMFMATLSGSELLLQMRFTTDRHDGGWSYATDERQGPAFIPAAALLGGNFLSFPTNIQVTSGEKWTIDVQNTALGRETMIVPFLAFWAEDTADAQRAA